MADKSGGGKAMEEDVAELSRTADESDEKAGEQAGRKRSQEKHT